MKNLDRSGYLRRSALDVLRASVLNGAKAARGKWRGRGTCGAFGRCHYRFDTTPVTDPRFNHALRRWLNSPTRGALASVGALEVAA